MQEKGANPLICASSLCCVNMMQARHAPLPEGHFQSKIASDGASGVGYLFRKAAQKPIEHLTLGPAQPAAQRFGE